MLKINSPSKRKKQLSYQLEPILIIDNFLQSFFPDEVNALILKLHHYYFPKKYEPIEGIKKQLQEALLKLIKKPKIMQPDKINETEEKFTEETTAIDSNKNLPDSETHNIAMTLYDAYVKYLPLNNILPEAWSLNTMPSTLTTHQNVYNWCYDQIAYSCFHNIFYNPLTKVFESNRGFNESKVLFESIVEGAMQTNNNLYSLKFLTSILSNINQFPHNDNDIVTFINNFINLIKKLKKSSENKQQLTSTAILLQLAHSLTRTNNFINSSNSHTNLHQLFSALISSALLHKSIIANLKSTFNSKAHAKMLALIKQLTTSCTSEELNQFFSQNKDKIIQIKGEKNKFENAELKTSEKIDELIIKLTTLTSKYLKSSFENLNKSKLSNESLIATIYSVYCDDIINNYSISMGNPRPYGSFLIVRNLSANLSDDSKSNAADLYVYKVESKQYEIKNDLNCHIINFGNYKLLEVKLHDNENINFNDVICLFNLFGPKLQDMNFNNKLIKTIELFLEKIKTISDSNLTSIDINSVIDGKDSSLIDDLEKFAIKLTEFTNKNDITIFANQTIAQIKLINAKLTDKTCALGLLFGVYHQWLAKYPGAIITEVNLANDPTKTSILQFYQDFWLDFYGYFNRLVNIISLDSVINTYMASVKTNLNKNNRETKISQHSRILSYLLLHIISASPLVYVTELSKKSSDNLNNNNNIASSNKENLTSNTLQAPYIKEKKQEESDSDNEDQANTSEIYTSESNINFPTDDISDTDSSKLNLINVNYPNSVQHQPWIPQLAHLILMNLISKESNKIHKIIYNYMSILKKSYKKEVQIIDKNILFSNEFDLTNKFPPDYLINVNQLFESDNFTTASNQELNLVRSLIFLNYASRQNSLQNISNLLLKLNIDDFGSMLGIPCLNLTFDDPRTVAKSEYLNIPLDEKPILNLSLHGFIKLYSRLFNDFDTHQQEVINTLRKFIESSEIDELKYDHSEKTREIKQNEFKDLVKTFSEIPHANSNASNSSTLINFGIFKLKRRSTSKSNNLDVASDNRYRK
ncbi:MAG: hypothetical protein Tsb005_09170 [Gammaproteobacteria bacterium]